MPTAATDPRKALEQAARRILVPLFRLLLRYGMPFTAFEQLAKRTYLDVAMRDFAIPGKKPSISRAAILSGLTRKEAQRLLSQAPASAGDDHDQDGHHNRAWRVLAAWTRDADFIEPGGKPRLLALQNDQRGFAELVRRHGGDMPVRAVLDELLRVGAVLRHGDGCLELVARPFLPRRSEIDKIDLLGGAVADLMDTVDHNLRFGDTAPRFQRRVAYQPMPASVAAEFSAMSAAQSMALLEQFDSWLARKEMHSSRAPSAEPRVRLGVGIHYFEERLDPVGPSAKEP
jgi:Family of unknown function (DUF6502)